MERRDYDDELSDSTNSPNNTNGSHKYKNSKSTTSLDHLVSSGVYIDHRNQKDLIHMHHSSPANTRRRSHNHNFRRNSTNDKTSLPLTNRNLQSLLLNRSISDQQQPVMNSVALDMDQYALEQGKYANSQSVHDPFEQSNNDFDNYSVNSMEFGESNPSSHHSSDSTSLDDVFMYEYNEENKNENWPDLAPLEEFIQNELSMANSQVNFGSTKIHENENKPRREVDANDVDESTPLVDHVHVNEMESLDSLQDNFRIRPTPIQPWEKSKERMQTKQQDNGGGPFRFTYFKDELPKTIHATNLSGFCDTSPNVHDRLVELFQISNKSSPPSTTSVMSSKKDVEPFWLDVLDPTEEEMKVLSKTFGIHPLTTEDIFLGEAREKVELFKSYYFICFTSFDVIYERRKQRAKEQEKKFNKLQEIDDNKSDFNQRNIFKWFKKKRPSFEKAVSTTVKSRTKKIREGELAPLNMYMIVFKHAVITFHFSATPHPINVRRRARMLKDYLSITSDWICYAIIDDITDSFAPMIETIETEVNSIEDAILKMHSGDPDSSDDESDCGGGGEMEEQKENVFVWRKRSKSTVEHNFFNSSKSSTSASSSKILGWKRKGDMLRRIGECRKRVMSVMRLLSSKADVIRGFSKRFNDLETQQQEIAMYLGDIQDHIVTMIQALNHYEKLLARFHSNYLAQINIDMTKVNNDTNDVLGKITILGTIVLPINVVTGLWGMNCIVPGQDYEGLAWFWGIVGAMALFSVIAYNYARRVTGL